MLRISLTVFFLFVSFLYSFTGLGEGASAVPEVKSMAKPDRVLNFLEKCNWRVK